MTIVLENGKITGCQKGEEIVKCSACEVSYMCTSKGKTTQQAAEEFLIKRQNKSNDSNTYEGNALEIARIVKEKQKQYGNSFNKAGMYLKLLYPDGVKPDQYNEMLALVRDFDKSMRIANGNQGNEDAWSDKAGYALLAVVRNRSR